MWVHNKATSEQESTPYKFTSKELDPETGLYYFGHRYLDPKLSDWISADPPLARGEYLPVPPINDKAKNHNSKLPGMGGIFNQINLDAYQYAGRNPVKLVDPDGRDIYLYFWSSEQTASGVGHVGVGVGSDENQVFYEANPTANGLNAPMSQDFKIEGSMKEVASKAHNSNEPELILKLNTSSVQDKATIEALDNFFKENKNWNAFKSDCADAAKIAIKKGGFDPGKAFLISTPQELAQDLYENNIKYSGNLIEEVKGDWKNYREGVGAVNGLIKKNIPGGK